MVQAVKQTGRREGISRRSREFLHELLLTPSPSGNEQQIQRLIRDRMQEVVQSCESDALGNLILGINTDKSKRVLLAGHCDQIAFIVKYISPGGYLYLDSVGGNDYGALISAHVTIHGREGPINGVVGRKPIYLQSNKEMSEVPPLTRIWVDIGASDQKEAEERVRL